MTKAATDLNLIRHVESDVEQPLFLGIPEDNEVSDERKIEKIRYHFGCIMKTLGLDLDDDSLKDTPLRVARMYVNEIFSGLDPRNYPAISVFDNAYGYDGMLIEKDIAFYSTCEHHFVPIIGRAHVAYIPGNKVIGLSKINRLVRYFARRPQVQERLTVEIANGLKSALQIDDVAVHIEADHLCVSSRGVQDTASSTCTSYFGGKFRDAGVRSEFLSKVRKG
ncbi:MAG TPA: GTP cyclohydrolase I FolE [Chryseosolibacter sp.]